MENSSILKLWLLTVIIGSLLVCLVLSFFLYNFEVIEIFPLFMIISFCSSVPAIIILIIVNLNYIKKYKEFKTYKKKLMLAHLYIGLTYVIFVILLFRKDGIFFSFITLGYLLVGLLTWKIHLKK